MCSLTVLIIASIPVIAFCQTDCNLPTTSDLKNVITNVFISADSPQMPAVSVARFHPVCLAHSQEQGRYRILSVLVEYTCSGHGNCPTGNAVEQFETECVGGTWRDQVLSSSDNTRTRNPTANFSTTPRDDCAFCSSPEFAIGINYTTDSLTHCVRCDGCDEGLMQCYGVSSDDCCSYYNDSTCVTACSSPFLPNTEYDCDCPVGTTGHNCSELIDCGSLGDPENGVISVSTTIYDSVANYSCNTGYTLTGDMSRTCLNTGLWSGSEPTCTEECKVKNCSQCGNKDPTVCETCALGYELSDNECKCPIEGCENCDTDVQKCDLCNKDMEFDTQRQKCIIDEGDGIGPVAIAGIVVGVVVFVVLMAVITSIVLYFVCQKK